MFASETDGSMTSGDASGMQTRRRSGSYCVRWGRHSMAERRMFAKTIIGSDAFLDMPQSTQALYFHLSMRADDDGFVNSPKSVMRLVGCNDDDMRVLCTKKFVIPFDSGVVVIKHWRIHNYISKDRYTETKYKVEKARLAIDENGSYTECIQDVDTCETTARLGQARVGEGRRG